MKKDPLNLNWQETEFVAFDTETTGAYPIGSELCEIGAVRFKGDRVIDKFQSLIKPKNLIPDEVIKIHGITNEMVEKEPYIEQVIGKFHKFINGAVCIAHHAPFDLGFISYEFERAKLKNPMEPVLCSSLLSRNLIKESVNHKLQTLVEFLKLPKNEAHRALDDSMSCMRVAVECFNRSGKNTLISDFFKIMGKELWWSDYSLESLAETPRFKNVINSIERNHLLEIVYSGGSRKLHPRVVIPKGIVRNPDGDFLAATEFDNDKVKRFYLSKIIAANLDRPVINGLT